MKNLNFFEKLWEHSRTLRRVGLVLVMCLISITQVWADYDNTKSIYLDISNAHWYTDAGCVPRIWVAKKADKSDNYVHDYDEQVSTYVYRFEVDKNAVCIQFYRYNPSTNAEYNWSGELWIDKDNYEGANACCYKYYNYYVKDGDGNGFSLSNRKTLNSSGGEAYFYAGNLTTTTYVSLLIGRWDNSKAETMSLVNNTEKLYYTNQLAYNIHAWTGVVGTTSEWTNANEGANRMTYASDYASQKYGYQFNDGSKYYLTKESTTKGSQLNIDYKENYSDIPTFTTTLNVKVKEGGAGSYSNGSTSNKPATTISLQGTILSSGGTSGSSRSSVTWTDGSSCSYNSVISGAVTTSYSSLGSTWNFDGWYINDEQVGTGTSYDFYQHSNTTVEARFTKKYTITYYKGTGDVSGSAPSATTHLSGETVTVKDNTGLLKKDGKVFAGWATSQSLADAGTVNYDPCSASKTFTITSDVTLYPVWKPGCYLINGTTLNSSDFIVGTNGLQDNSYSVNGVTFSSKNFKFGSTKSSLKGQTYGAGTMLVYDTKKANTKITIYAYNNNNSNKNLYYQVIKEGESVSDDAYFEVANKSEGIYQLTINHSKGTRVVFCSNSGNLRICQMRVIEEGDPIKAVGEKGFQIALPGRSFSTVSSSSAPYADLIDGVSLKNNTNTQLGQTTTYLDVRGTSGSTSTQYISFTTTAATKLQVTTVNDDYNTFYLKKGSAALNTSTDATYSGKNTTININLSETGTWYILGTQAHIKKIAFDDFVAATAPTAFAATATTSSSVILSITDGTNTKWEIYYSTSSTPPTASTAATVSGITSKTPTVTGLTAGTDYYMWVRSVADYFNKSSWVALTSNPVTTDTPSCSATAPGSISKGTASGGTGTITLTASGEPASNNTWYWQSAADGTATNLGSGETKDVSATGTYYLRSYCSDNGGCWSDAVSVDVSAEDLLTIPTATFSNSYYIIGGSSLNLSSLWNSDSEGSVTYSVQSAGGTGASISTAAFTATTAGTATVRASQAANGNYSAITKDATIIVLPGYATSIDFEAIIDASESSSWKSTMEGRNYKLTQSNSSNWSMDDGTGGTKQADKGLKIKETGDNAGKIAFAVHANQTVELKVGTLAGTGSGKASFSINGGASYSDITGASTASTGDPVTYTYKENTDQVYVFKTKSSDWNILQHITIGYKVTYDKGSNGTGTVDPMYKTHGTSLTLSSGTFSRDDYVQDGWSTIDGGDKVYDLGGSYTSNAEITLYPHWTVACTDPGLAYAVTEVAKTYGDAEFTNMLTNANSAVRYSSTVPAVATVNPTTGQVTIESAGSTTIKATIADDATYCDEEVSYSLVVSTAALPGTASTGTATSVTHNSASLPYSITNVTGVGDVVIKVYAGESLIKTIDNQSIETSGSCSATGLSAETTYTYTVTLIGDANHNDKAETSKSTSFTTSAEPTLTALVDGTLYKANGIFSGDIPTSDTYVGGISDNGKFFFEGSASADPHNSMKWKQYTSTTLNGKEFTAIIYFDGASTLSSNNPTTRAMKFILPSAGTLTIYYRDNNKGAGKVKLNKSGSEPTWSSTTKGDDYDTTSELPAGTYYLYATGESTGILGVQFDATAATYTVSASVDPAGYGTLSAASITDVTSGTAISASSNVLTVGASSITATPAATTAQYTYAFNNWTWTPAGETVTSDVTATANFTRTPKNYTLSWVTDGDPLTGDYTTGTVPFGTAIVAPNTPTKTGYTFSVWSPSVAATMPAANTTYTATWTKDTYTITYVLHDGEEGSVSGKTTYQITDDDYDLPTPVWAGHTFLGWYATYSADVYSDPVSVLTSGSTGNKTYHAKWADGVNVVWTITKVDSKLYKGGTGYSVKAVVDNTSWTGHDNLVLSASDGVTLGTPTKSTVGSKAQIVADFSISGSLAEDAITFSLYAPATGVYAAIEDEEEVAIDACPSGGATVLFNQNFSADGAGSVDYTADTKRDITSVTKIVGSGTDEFTYVGQVKKSGAGVAVNSATGGNSTNATGFFQAYCNATSGNYALVKTSDFAVTAPTAIKVEMDIWYRTGSSATDYSVTFGIGDGFSNGTGAPDALKVHSGFSIYNNSSPTLMAYKDKNTTISTAITQSTWLSVVWVINNSGLDLTYDNPTGSGTTTLANDKFDLWLKTQAGAASTYTKVVSARAATTADKDLQNIYIGDPNGKNHEFRLDNVKVSTVPSAADFGVATSLAWSETVDDDTHKKEVDDVDPDFRIYALPTPSNAGGPISYTSSNESVATVSSDGTVHIVDDGSTTITAAMPAYGCYSAATSITYSLVVANTCDDTPGTIVNSDGSAIAGNAVNRGACDELVLKLTGHSGSTIQWKKDGVDIPSANAATYSVPKGESGVYTAVVRGGCPLPLEATNSITVTTADGTPNPTIYANDFYVKSDKWFGYRLMKINEGETVSVKTDPVGWAKNTDFFITTDASGIVSISGRKDISTPSNKTLTLTIANECDGSVDKDITIREMAATPQPTIAWIATNNDGGNGQKDNVKADESTNTGLYKELEKYYTITPRNCYWTTSEAELVKEYSQYDLIILTDYPNSQTGPSGKSASKSYTNAIGLLIDHKPIMTFEAFVAGCPNWGIASNPQNTQATQTDMTLLCNADEIFGTTGSGKFAAGEAIKVTSASSGQALQGFPVASSPDFVFIGKITDNDEKTYVACCERQHEIAARMMVFGLNSSIMSSLTDDGKTMVKGFIDYLLKDDPASVPDCSVIFNGGGDDDSWYTTYNWEAGLLPDQYASVRIDAPCVVPANASPAKAGGIKIHVGDAFNGSLTIEPAGCMIVEKTITRIEGNAYTIHMPTEPEDLIIQSNSTAQGALIFDNESARTQATVQMYSKGRYYDGVYNWQYVAVPLVSASRWNMGDWAYCFDNSIGNWTGNDVCPAFSAVGVTRMDDELPTYEFYGPLASTKNQTLTLYTSAAGNDGYNMIGNSWTAPIQIVNFQPGDFGTALYQVNIYNTGHDPEGGPAAEESKDQQGRWKTIPIAATQAAIDAGTWKDLKVIPSMQAFEVQNATGANTTLTLNYDRLVRTLPTDPNLNETKRAPRRTPVERTAVPQMRITLKDETTCENLYLFSGEQFSEGFDNGWDGVYNAGEAGYMQIYMLSPIGNLEISAQPEMEGTTFGFTAGSREVYTFSFKYVGNEELYFNDLKEKKSTLINDENEYTFTAQEGENGIRFMISATPYNSQQITTGMTDLDAEAPQAQKVIYNDKLYIIRGGKVFSADGHLVK